jgi:hypothetical protein
VLPSESRISRPERRARRRNDLTAVERLEERTLLSFSNLGYSLPDLTITGLAGPRAAWGGMLNVSVYLQNIGASSTTEPLSQAAPTDTLAASSPYSSVSKSDAPASTVQVIISPTAKSLRGAITLGTFEVPASGANLNQNSVTLPEAEDELPLPAQPPPGFKGAGGKFYVWFYANSTSNVLEVTHTNNLSKPVPVQIASQPAAQLRAIALEVPAKLQPGDTIHPIGVVENFGTKDSGPVTVELVESATRQFNPLAVNVVVGTATIDVPAASSVPTGGNYKTFAQGIVNPPANVVSFAFTSPRSDGNYTLSTPPPGKYYLGIVVDPTGSIKQLSLPKNALQAVHVVGPPEKELPPAFGIVSAPNNAAFPNPPTGELIGNVLQ